MEKELERVEVKQDEKEPVTLDGDAAILLWLEGEDAWNKWMEKNPKANVDFSGVDFSYKALKERFPDNENLQKLIEENKDEEFISFSEYKFSGEASFAFARFLGMGHFGGATFNGEANFVRSTLSGLANFRDATFSGDAFFVNVIFSGASDFANALFNGGARFYDAIFSIGMDFQGAIFIGEADFSNATFNDVVYFNDATFSGDAYFDLAMFNDYADFRGATFSGKADFDRALFNNYVDYLNSSFESILIFKPQEAENIESLNFKGAAFESLFTISGNFNCIPDLRQTKTSHHVDLSNLSVKLNRDFIKNWGVEKALDKEDSEKLCRLKEIAESNKNHKRALAFNADELRASRWGILNPWQSILDCIYSVTSNYGQSIARPFCWLVFSIFMFAQFTIGYSDTNKKPILESAIVISVATVTPFISISKEARNSALKKVFKQEVPDRYYLYSYLHAGISFIFIFLIGLGLRNRFRI